MSSLDPKPQPPVYWRSLAQLADAPEYRAFLEAEFPAAADPSGLTRRRWMQLMGASLALASVSGCRWEKKELLPFVDRPPERIPGVPERFATAIDIGGVATGLLVTSYDGRPIKIEGNPKHPQSRGATDVFSQAAILQLYDPDRNQRLLPATDAPSPRQSWPEFAEFAKTHFAELRKTGGAGLRLLAEAHSSPTLAALRARLLKEFPHAAWHEYEPVSRDNERAGARQAFGKPYRTQCMLDRAQVILCLDADPLGTHPAAVEYARALVRGRDATRGTMSRLYAVEGCFSLTGAAADHRLPLTSSQVAAFVAAIEQRLAGRAAGANHGLGEKADKFVAAVAKDLLSHRGRGLVMAGPRQPPEVHAAVHRINAFLENVGQTLAYTADPEPERPSHVEAIRALAADITAHKVQTLVILGGNPAYDAPADLGLADALESVAVRIRLGPYEDETSARSTWYLPQAHFLESWGDARSYDGTYSIQQPLIEPLHQGRSAIELLALLLGDAQPKAEQLVRATFREIAGEKDFEARWSQSLQDGLLAGSRWPRETPKLADPGRVEPAPPAAAAGGRSLEIVFCQDASVYDGRFANNGWLQEMPNPMTRITWDNAAVISPATAQALGVSDNMLVRLKYAGRQCELPVYVMPGQADRSIAVALGYGRTAAGQVGGIRGSVETVGVDVYSLRTSRAMDFDVGLSIEPTAEKHTLAVVQDHQAIDAVGYAARAARAGELVREATLAHYREHPDFARHVVEQPDLKPLWDEKSAEGRRWGMAIDLSKCIGCNACVVACNAENNVPIVGRERVLRGREMHWIRVDRYFKGDPQDPQAVHQPVACQQCEMAPCEQVCPVAATVHSKEGLNDMVYNRCVGTRYCANNCPYKVRRFNFFNYHKNLEDSGNEVLKMLYNPEVTVRQRGVMEKCTYCVQRIQAVKIHAKNQRRPIVDGEIRTACQQVCPTQAIVFGDLADTASQVARAHADSRAYGMLAEMSFHPRTMYLARIRHPNPELQEENEESRKHENTKT